MASLCLVSNPSAWIEYSIVDGEIVEFELAGVVLYSKPAGIEIPNWRIELAKLAIVNEWDRELYPGSGLRAFIYPLIEAGLMAEMKL